MDNIGLYTIEEASNLGGKYKVLYEICLVTGVDTTKTLYEVGEFTLNKIDRLIMLIGNRMK